MPDYARTRADIDFCQTPKGPVAGRIDMADSEVEILEVQNGWYRVKPVHLQRVLKGFVPEQALVFPPKDKPVVFPMLGDQNKVSSVPANLPLADFQQWLSSGGRPAWLPAEQWDALPAEDQAGFAKRMQAQIDHDPASWNAWLAGVSASGRLDQAVMDEWVVTATGGRDVYSITDGQIYQQPNRSASVCGWVMKGQIMHWTGAVRFQDDNGTIRPFYEVTFYRMSRPSSGWYRADLASFYNYPMDDDDPSDPANAEKVFDLSQPILRFPADHEIQDAKAARWTGAQYIDLKDVLGKALRHFCLCGEFCVATLAGQDIIPTLKSWYASTYWRVKAILGNPHEGTGSDDLLSLLHVVGLDGKTYSSMPTTIQNVKARLDGGDFAIATCRINSLGKVKENGSILHWVILEDVLPVGTSGWVRIYNPFNNMEEVYPFDMFMRSGGSGFGLWITGAKPN